MIRNYLLISIRNLRRQFSYSAITILGLSIGLACSLVIFLYVYGEWSYDKHFRNADRIYRVAISFFNIGRFASGPEKLADVLPAEFAGLQTMTRIQKERDVLFKVRDQSHKEALVYFTDSAFFHVFSYRFVAGDPIHALKGPASVVLTEAMAEKFFGTTQALGETVEIGKDKMPFTVTGIVKDDPHPSHLKSEIWASIQSRLKDTPYWTSAEVYNYVLLNKNSQRTDLEAALGRVMEKHVYPASGAPENNISLEAYLNDDNSVKFYVQPLLDIYLHSKLNLELSPGGNESNIYNFLAISLFILVLAAVNFINLTTARASRRAKEVGVRKTMGTTRARLVVQFLMESILLSGMAMVLALALAEVFLLLFERISGTPLATSYWYRPATGLFILGFTATVGILSGIYPAFYLTAFSPIKVLKGNLLAQRSDGFRNLLVIFQFSVSITLVICTAVVFSQLQFMQTRDLGFSANNVVTIDNAELLGNSAEVYKTELSRLSGVTVSSFHIGEPGSKRTLAFYKFQTPHMENAMTINTFFGDADYVSLMGYHLINGRGFSKELASDSVAVILNEAAVKALDLGKSPIGAVLDNKFRVIGEVSDFHWESLRSSIAPVAIMLSKEKGQLGFKISGSARSFLQKAEIRWNQLVADEPFRYHFLDDNFGELMRKEEIFGQAVVFFTGLAICISCLGLYGLSAYTAEQRTKEIGIRKVLGVTAPSIVLMLNKKFTLLIVIAVIVAVPASAFIAQKWLEGFAYKTDLGMTIFVESVAGALLVAWFTVSFHSLKAAFIDPAETLKYE